MQFSERYSCTRDLPDFARLTSTIINHEHMAWSACGVGLFWPKKSGMEVTNKPTLDQNWKT